MNLTAEISAEIVAKASTLEERLANDHFLPHEEADEREIERRIDRWCERASQGDRRGFEKLLALRGLNVGSLRTALGRVRLANADRLPAWIDLLQDGLRAAASRSPEPPRFVDGKEPWPFEQILVPFVEAASSRLRVTAGAACDVIGDQAHVSLERKLLYWLVNVCSSALILEFSIFRLNRQPVLGHRLTQLAGDTSSEIHREYVGRMLGGGLVSFFHEYSVLARAVARLMENWIESTAEFLARLSSDWSSLAHHFEPRGEIGRVEELTAGLSDPHRGGRSVIILKFSSGLTVVYKPKSLGTEEAYSHLLEWLNRQGVSLPLRGLNVLARPGYGWAKFIEHTAPADDSERAHFYRRSGMLLCLFYVLESTDVHAENLIAAGEHPVLVDAETLITPALEDGEFHESQDWAEGRAIRRMNTSVLRVGMLPWWRPQADGQVHDPSALGGVGGEELTTTVWQGVDTDSVCRQPVKVQLGRNRNVPFAPADAAEPGHYVEEVVTGFREMYELLLANRDVLLGPESPLEDLAGASMRLVFRDTATYFTVLKNSMDAAVLRDGADRSVDLEVLSRVLLVSESNARFASFVRAEKQALTELDVPFFTVCPRSRNLEIGPGRTIENCFSQAGYERVLERFRKLGAEDLEEQIRIIRGSFWAKMASRPSPVALGQRSVERHADEAAGAGAGQLLDEALKIARQLQTVAVHGRDGSMTWLSLVRRPQAENYSFGPLGPGLFDGLGGIALFLAALHKVTGKAEFREAAIATLQPIRRALSTYQAILRTGKKTARQDITLGATGLGSVAYACTRIGKWLEEESPLQLARTAASLIEPELFRVDTSLDVFSGVAGAILGLLSLHEIEASTLATAIDCGDHVLRCSNGTGGNGSGPRDWARSLGTGFARGSAGVGFAFVRLYETTRERRFLRAGEDLLASASEIKGWDSIDGDWFAGAAGVGLGWLGSLAALDHGASHEIVDLAVEHCQAASLNAPDQVCHGIAGRLDFLVEAACRMHRPDLLNVARKQAACSIRRASRRGGFHLHPELPAGAFTPGFFEGASGIGYEFLRLAFPESLSSVLLWQ